MLYPWSLHSVTDDAYDGLDLIKNLEKEDNFSIVGEKQVIEKY